MRLTVRWRLGLRIAFRADEATRSESNACCQRNHPPVTGWQLYYRALKMKHQVRASLTW